MHRCLLITLFDMAHNLDTTLSMSARLLDGWEGIAGKRIGCPKLATGDYRTIHVHAAATPETSTKPPGFNEKGKKTLAHPDYPRIQAWWHPTRNQGKQPTDYTHGSNNRVWLLCPGCIHGCGRRHEWNASVYNLTHHSDQIVCPSCESKKRKFCPCRSVAANARLSREWHPDNPPPELVAISSDKKFLWKCRKRHPHYKASCDKRSTCNTGCPACWAERRGKVQHPVLSEGRPDLASQWHSDNEKAASEVTLGSNFKALWVCPNDPSHPPWLAPVYRRALQGSGCPECAQKQRFATGPRKFGAG